VPGNGLAGGPLKPRRARAWRRLVSRRTTKLRPQAMHGMLPEQWNKRNELFDAFIDINYAYK
jgi:hypothetical protein